MKIGEFEAALRREYGPFGPEEGLRAGEAEAELRGVACCWMPTVKALEYAAEKGCNLVLAHEELGFPYEFLGRPDDWRDWEVNRRRFEVIEQHELAVLRPGGTKTTSPASAASSARWKAAVLSKAGSALAPKARTFKGPGRGCARAKAAIPSNKQDQTKSSRITSAPVYRRGR